MNPFFDTAEETELQEDTIFLADIAARIILFNDEWHTFEEVIEQIILATGYKTTKAELMTHEVHTKGRSIIYSGDLGKCLHISEVLEEINLGTEVRI